MQLRISKQTFHSALMKCRMKCHERFLSLAVRLQRLRSEPGSAFGVLDYGFFVATVADPAVATPNALSKSLASPT